MKIDKEQLEDHQVKLVVEFDSEILESAKRKAARNIAKKTKIPGFRPGKAPYGVILKHVGEATILDDALEDIVNQKYPEIIEKTEIKPYGAGTLENVSSLDPLTLEFIVPLDAEVTLGDYKSLRIAFEPKEITDDDIEETIQTLQQQNAIVETVDHEARIGNLARITLSSKPVGDEPIDDQYLYKDYQTTLLIHNEEEDPSQEWPFPGFSVNLLGLSAGEEKTFTHKFDDEYRIEGLQGKEISYSVKIEAIQTQTLPELNDEFAQTVGDFETFDKLRENIKNNLIAQADQEYLRGYDQSILDTIIADADIKYPPQMLEREIEDYKKGLERSLSQQGLNFDIYKKIREIDDESFNKEIKEASEKRLQLSLVIFKIAENENIEIDENEVKQETTRAINYFNKMLTPRDAKRINPKEVASNIYTNAVMDHITKNTMKWLRTLAKGELETEKDEINADEIAKVSKEEQANSDDESRLKSSDIETQVSKDIDLETEKDEIDVDENAKVSKEEQANSDDESKLKSSDIETQVSKDIDVDDSNPDIDE